MASLVSLPNELKDLVFEHLSCSDFIRLSRTCRELHACSLPLAYRDLLVTWANTQEEVVNGPKLHHLLRTLIQRPDYANYIKSLRFEAVNCVGFGPDAFLRTSIPGSHVKLNSEDETLLRCAVTDFGLSHDKSWVDALVGHQQFYVVVAMVVAHCAKLESLDLSIAFLLQNDWFEEMIQRGLNAESGLSTWMDNLKHVRLTCDTNGDEWTPGCLDFHYTALYPFYLPKLETLEIARFEISSDDHDDLDDFGNHQDAPTWFWPIAPESPPTASHLTTLRLLRCSAPIHFLNIILRQNPNLRVFDLDMLVHPDSPSYNFTDLKTSLNRFRATLTHLTLRFQLYSDGEYSRGLDDITTGAFGSLHKFTLLTHLEISLHTLNGSYNAHGQARPLAALLPPNLQELTITDDLWMFEDFQESLEDIEAMAIFRRFLTGEQLAPDWRNTTSSAWSTSNDPGRDWRRRFLSVRWVPGAQEGEWRTATPHLRKFVYDLRKRGYLSNEYWNKGVIRKQFRIMCRDQGLKGEVLWEKIKYYIGGYFH